MKRSIPQGKIQWRAVEQCFSQCFSQTVKETHVIWVQLTVASQAMQQSLDVGSEDVVEGRVVGLVQMLSQTVPEVKGNLRHLSSRSQRK